MEKINNEKIDKYKCLYSNNNLNIKGNKYIQSSKFISNKSFLIFTNKNIIKYNYNYNYNSESNIIDSVELERKFKESNYIYDYDIIYNEYESNKYLCLCSKDNPIRILDDKLSLIKSFTLENKQKESYLSSIFIKYEPFGLNIYTGKNHLSKIDLIKQKEVFTIYNKNYNYLSSFDFNLKYSCYFLGSYNNRLILGDYKTDKIIGNYKQEKSINQIKILNNKEYKILIGYRNSNFICLFDIRKMDSYLNKLERSSKGTKKINFVLDENENNLYSGTDNGKLIRYNFEKFEKKEMNIYENNNLLNKNLNETIGSFNKNVDNNETYETNNINREENDIGLNNAISSIDLNNDFNLILITNGEMEYENTFYSLNKNNDSDESFEIKNNYEESQFHIYKI